MDFNLNINSNVPIGVTFNLSPITEQKLDQALALLNQLVTDQKKEIVRMTKFTDDLMAEAAAQSTVEDSIVALLTTYHDAVVAAAGDPAAQDAALAAFVANKEKMAAALLANTPSGP